MVPGNGMGWVEKGYGMGCNAMCVEWHRSLRMDYNAGSSIIIMPYVLFPTLSQTPALAPDPIRSSSMDGGGAGAVAETSNASK